MGVPRFFKTPGPKRFEYSPIYWDPDKEERDDRIKRIKQEMGIETESDPGGTTITRGSFRQFKKNTKVRASRNSNIRLVVILAVLFIISYLIFFR
jgi:hypothetical protein